MHFSVSAPPKIILVKKILIIFLFFDIFLENLPYMKLKAYAGDQQAWHFRTVVGTSIGLISVQPVFKEQKWQRSVAIICS